MSERLFVVEGRTDVERAATRAAVVRAQGRLFDVEAGRVAVCAVCGSDAHSTLRCRHGEAPTVFEAAAGVQDLGGVAR